MLYTWILKRHLTQCPTTNYSQRFGILVSLAIYGSGSVNTLTIQSNVYPSMVPTPLYCLPSMEFPRETFSGLCYFYYSSMTFLNVYRNPYHYCSLMTLNVCPPYHLLLTVNFYNLTSTSSPTGVLSGTCSSTIPNAHCWPSVLTIIPVPTSFLITSTIVKSLHRTQHKDLGITMSCNLSWSIHIAQISSKAYRILGLLHRTFLATNQHHNKKQFIYFPGPLTTALRFSDLETCLD